jgi:tetratricopeptide (TPR) repeat protein
LRELKDLLYELYLVAGPPTLDEIASALLIAQEQDDLPGAPARDTVNRIIGSSEIPPSQADTVSVAVTLARLARWDQADVEARVRSAWVRARFTEPMGSPIAQLDPSALEIHRSIDARTAGDMTTYVLRAHDLLLQEAVDVAVAGASVLVTLIGDSSTGKTRTCWEAVRRLPAGWRVWHPLAPTRPEAALAGLSAVGPRTVVWLNEAQHYFLEPGADVGERVAAGLRTVLADPDRSPVLILATLWHDFWFALTQQPRHSGARDLYAQPRALLAGIGRHLTMPRAFTLPDDVEALRETARVDPQLAQAAREAEDGETTQYLAGVPVLTERYRNASSGARALIEAAMDARRLGHRSDLPLSLLTEAAESYLTDREYDRMSDGWVEEALEYCAQPCRGTRGPLTRSRLRNGGQNPDPPLYRLADYLDQHGRRTRQFTRPPAGMWQALADHGNIDDLRRIARSARDRGLLRTEAQFYVAAATTGDTLAPVALAQLLYRAKHLGDDRPWVGRAAGSSDVGDFVMAQQLEEDGNTQDALIYYQRAAAAGFSYAAWAAGMKIQSDAGLDEALVWLDDRTGEGIDEALHAAAWLLHRADRFNEALTYARRAVDAGNKEALVLVGHSLRDSGRDQEALAHYEKAAATGDENTMTEAEACAAELIEKTSGTADALAWLEERATTTGRTGPLGEAHLVLSRAGRIDEALVYAERAAESGDDSALSMAADMLQEADRVEDALALYQRNAEAFNRHDDYRAASRILQQTYGVDAALAWLEPRAAGDSTSAMIAMSRVLQEAGRFDEALRHSRRAADGADERALARAVEVLTAAGRTQEATTLRRYGWNPDGNISDPWRVDSA